MGSNLPFPQKINRSARITEMAHGRKRGTSSPRLLHAATRANNYRLHETVKMHYERKYINRYYKKFIFDNKLSWLLYNTNVVEMKNDLVKYFD